MMRNKINRIIKKLITRIYHKLILLLGFKVIIRTSQYGRLGNNIQQILLLYAHYKMYGFKFFFSDNYESFYKIDVNFHKLPGYIDINKKSEESLISKEIIFDNNMYLYTRQYNKFFKFSFLSNRIFRDSFIPKKKFLSLIPELVDEIRPLFHNYISPKNITEISIKELNRNCVIHLRGGDTIPPQNLNHISNPLSYYLWLKKFHSEIIIVQEPKTSRFKGCDESKQGRENPILTKLYEIFEVKKVISGSISNDFAILANSMNVASSGVASFPLAACLLSKNLRNFYYSNAFLSEHINPESISNKVNKYCFKLDESFFVTWNRLSPEDRIKYTLKF